MLALTNEFPFELKIVRSSQTCLTESGKISFGLVKCPEISCIIDSFYQTGSDTFSPTFVNSAEEREEHVSFQ